MKQRRPEDLIEFESGVSPKDLSTDQQTFLLELTRFLGDLEESGAFERVAVEVTKEKLYPDRPVDEPKRAAFNFKVFPNGNHDIDKLNTKPAGYTDDGKKAVVKLIAEVVRKSRKPFEKNPNQAKIEME